MSVSLCRHYHPMRYAWHCAAGYRAPRDCGGCVRYDADQATNAPDSETRRRQWTKAHHLSVARER